MSLRKELGRFFKCQLICGTAMMVGFAALFLSWYFVVFGIMEPACQEKTEEEVRERVIHHPFWRVEMDAEAVNEMADTILASKDKDSLVFVSEDGELVVDTDPAHINQASHC